MKKVKKIVPTLVFTLLLNGGLNHTLFRRFAARHGCIAGSLCRTPFCHEQFARHAFQSSMAVV